MSAVPCSAASSPRTTRIVVDFPAPLGRTKPVTWPGETVNVIPSSASVGPNRLRSPDTSMVASLMRSPFSVGECPFDAGCTPGPVSARCRWLGPSWDRRPGMLKAQASCGEGECVVMRVLVVEDFEPTARAIVTGLRREGMAVDAVYDGAAALSQLALTRYDVVVLDRDLPGVHGDEICRRLAAGRSPSRILMLTAAGSLSDRVEGLKPRPPRPP